MQNIDISYFNDIIFSAVLNNEQKEGKLTVMKKPPESYVDARRPPVDEAMRLEGGSFTEAAASLERKGYFEPPPGPWQVGVGDRGMGRNDYAVLDRFGDLIATVENQATAELIVSAVNAKRG